MGHYSEKALKKDMQLSSQFFSRCRGRWLCACWVSATCTLSSWEGTARPFAHAAEQCLVLRAETPACTVLAGISPCLLQAKYVPAHFPSFLDILEEEILLGQCSIALVAGLM